MCPFSEVLPQETQHINVTKIEPYQTYDCLIQHTNKAERSSINFNNHMLISYVIMLLHVDGYVQYYA